VISAKGPDTSVWFLVSATVTAPPVTESNSLPNRIGASQPFHLRTETDYFKKCASFWNTRLRQSPLMNDVVQSVNWKYPEYNCQYKFCQWNGYVPSPWWTGGNTEM